MRDNKKLKMVYTKTMILNRVCVLLLGLYALMTGITAEPIPITQHPIQSKERYELMKTYAKMHYGMNHANLINPKMIVLHYTATHSLEGTIKMFESTTLAKYRDRLTPFGDVNVGAHFLVDKEGNVTQLLPTTLMARHVIGFNHVAIGIENISKDGGDLSDEQIIANVKLIRYILQKHPTIKYMLGHMEYMNQTYPHFQYFSNEISYYEPSIKVDPGFMFMKRVRFLLNREYGIVLER